MAAPLLGGVYLIRLDSDSDDDNDGGVDDYNSTGDDLAHVSETGRDALEFVWISRRKRQLGRHRGEAIRDGVYVYVYMQEIVVVVCTLMMDVRSL